MTSSLLLSLLSNDRLATYRCSAGSALRSNQSSPSLLRRMMVSSGSACQSRHAMSAKVLNRHSDKPLLLVKQIQAAVHQETTPQNESPAHEGDFRNSRASRYRSAVYASTTSRSTAINKRPTILLITIKQRWSKLLQLASSANQDGRR